MAIIMKIFAVEFNTQESLIERQYNNRLTHLFKKIPGVFEAWEIQAS